MGTTLRTRRWWLAGASALAVVATGSVAYATIPDAGGVIHTCYTKASGAWRVIDTGLGQTCKANELPLDVYSKGGADALFLDQTEANGLYLGKTEKAADSDKLGGFAAHRYLLGGGVQVMDGGDLPNGGTSSLTCCEELNLTPPMTVELRCDTSGNTTLVASSPESFRWWWNGTFGNATPVTSGFEAEFGVANGVAQNSLRTTTGGISLTYDLDTFIGATCTFGWTWAQTFHTNPGP